MQHFPFLQFNTHSRIWAETFAGAAQDGADLNASVSSRAILSAVKLASMFNKEIGK